MTRARSRRADAAEILSVSIDAEDVAEFAGVDQLLELLDAGVVEQQVAGHEDEVTFLREPDELVDLGARHRRRLLDEDVFTGLERELCKLVVRGHGGGDHHRVECGILEHLLEVSAQRVCGYRA